MLLQHAVAQMSVMKEHQGKLIYLEPKLPVASAS